MKATTLFDLCIAHGMTITIDRQARRISRKGKPLLDVYLTPNSAFSFALRTDCVASARTTIHSVKECAAILGVNR